MQLSPKIMQIDSQEYKLILDVKKLLTKEQAQNDVLKILENQLVDKRITLKKSNKIKEKEVTFLDTEKQELYRLNNFIIRVKRKTSGNINFDVTFKIRSENQTTVKNQDLFSINQMPIFEIEEQKFEEDILSQSVKKFSLSTELEYNIDPLLKSWNDVISIFPNLKINIANEVSLMKVNDLKMMETNYQLGEILLDGMKKAEVGFSVWSLSDDPDILKIAEFDIDVSVKDLVSSDSNEKNVFSDPAIDEIKGLYQELQNCYTLDKNNKTKTEYIYDFLKENP